MITNFKIFEWNQESGKRDMVDEFGQEFIDNYFRENYGMDESEVHNYLDIWNYIDDDRFVKDWIDGRVNGDRLVDLDEEDMRKYIIDNLLENEKVTRFIYKRAKKLKLDIDSDLSPDGILEEIVEELEKDDLITIIEKKADKEEECIREYWEGIYYNSDAKDILEELYGEKDLQHNAHKYLDNYVDFSKMVEDFYDKEDLSFKKDYIVDQMETDKELQKRALKNNPDNSILLLDIMSEDDSIGDTYKFQNTYMKSVLKEMIDIDEDDLYVAKQLKKLNDKFEILPKIREKYKKYCFYIDVENYNL